MEQSLFTLPIPVPTALHVGVWLYPFPPCHVSSWFSCAGSEIGIWVRKVVRDEAQADTPEESVS